MLKDLRKKANLTQEELAQRVGVRKSAICMYEKGTRVPSVGTLRKLARALSVSNEEILDCIKETAE